MNDDSQYETAFLRLQNLIDFKSNRDFLIEINGKFVKRLSPRFLFQESLRRMSLVNSLEIEIYPNHLEFHKFINECVKDSYTNKHTIVELDSIAQELLKKMSTIKRYAGGIPKVIFMSACESFLKWSIMLDNKVAPINLNPFEPLIMYHERGCVVGFEQGKLAVGRTPWSFKFIENYHSKTSLIPLDHDLLDLLDELNDYEAFKKQWLGE